MALLIFGRWRRKAWRAAREWEPRMKKKRWCEQLMRCDSGVAWIVSGGSCLASSAASCKHCNGA
eukprot:scaffold3052_cov130-Isochrysis_galbana.AAC.2